MATIRNFANQNWRTIVIKLKNRRTYDPKFIQSNTDSLVIQRIFHSLISDSKKTSNY